MNETTVMIETSMSLLHIHNDMTSPQSSCSIIYNNRHHRKEMENKNVCNDKDINNYIGPNEQKFIEQKYNDKINQIISKYNKDKNATSESIIHDTGSNHILNTANDNIDENISQLYTRIKEDGIYDLLKRVEKQQNENNRHFNYDDNHENSWNHHNNSKNNHSSSSSTFCSYYDNVNTDNKSNHKQEEIKQNEEGGEEDNECEESTTMFEESIIYDFDCSHHDNKDDKNNSNNNNNNNDDDYDDETASFNMIESCNQLQNNNHTKTPPPNNTSFNHTDPHYHHQNQQLQQLKDNNDTTISSIELVRKSNYNHSTTTTTTYNNNDISALFQSPQQPSTYNHHQQQQQQQQHYKKRLASTSGKKGTDLQRTKTMYNNESSVCSLLPFDNHELFEFTNNDNIMNATTHYNNNAEDEDEKEDGNRDGKKYNHHQKVSSFLDNALLSQSPILRRQSLLLSSSTPSSTSIHNDTTTRSRTRGGNVDFDFDMDSMEYQNESSIRSNYNDNDSIESVMSKDDDSHYNQQQSSHHNSNNTFNNNSNYDDQQEDDIIYTLNDDENNQQHVNVTLRENSNFHLDPLQVYRAPKWTVSHHLRNKMRLKDEKRKKKINDKKYDANNINVHQLRKNVGKIAKSIPTCTFIDEPFRDFGTRAADRLEVVLDWLLEQDIVVDISEWNQDKSIDPTANGRAVVISVPPKQVMRLIRCTLMKNGVHQVPRHLRPLENGKKRSGNNNINTMDGSNSSEINGGTLIVVRSKEDVVDWLGDLRENTSYSVLSHYEISSTERRRVTILSKCIGYDIVVTTYDALKAKEVASTVNENGRVIQQGNSQGAWLSTKSNNAEDESKSSCKVLSRLHSIHWTRIICIDCLGSSSYLTKLGTARMEAVASIKAKSRLVFFAKTNDNVTKHAKYYYEDKLKDSRRQLVPLAKILDLPENRTFDKIVSEAMLDLRDVKDDREPIIQDDNNDSDDDDSNESEFSECDDISEAD